MTHFVRIDEDDVIAVGDTIQTNQGVLSVTEAGSDQDSPSDPPYQYGYANDKEGLEHTRKTGPNGDIGASPIGRAQKTAPVEITKEEWIQRSAARFKDRGGLTEEEAREQAKASFETVNGDLSENPEDAADEDMSYWDNDEIPASRASRMKP